MMYLAGQSIKPYQKYINATRFAERLVAPAHQRCTAIAFCCELLRWERRSILLEANLINGGDGALRRPDIAARCPYLGRQTVAGDPFHLLAETIEFGKRRVIIGRDPDPLKLL